MDPVTDILTCSFSEGRFPPSWKAADIVPIPKRKPVKDVNKNLCPIYLTPVLSKIAEEFVVEEYVRPALLKKIDSNQLGSIPGSPTTHALLSMVHRGPNKLTEPTVLSESYCLTTERPSI